MPDTMVLASTTEGGRTYYYHPKDGPCARQRRVAVHPWWDLETTVWICDECVARMAQVLAEESPGTQWMRGWQFWSRRGRAPNVP